MPLAAPDLFKSATSAAASRPRVVRQPSYTDYFERARCWLGDVVTGGKKQMPHMYDALSLHVTQHTRLRAAVELLDRSELTHRSSCCCRLCALYQVVLGFWLGALCSLTVPVRPPHSDPTHSTVVLRVSTLLTGIDCLLARCCPLLSAAVGCCPLSAVSWREWTSSTR